MGGYVQAIQAEYLTNYDKFHSLLVVAPEEVESHVCVNLLNYFGFPVHIEEDNLRGAIKREMGFGKDEAYPLLIINSSSNAVPNADLSSAGAILHFLREQNFIKEHKSHSAKEQ